MSPAPDANRTPAAVSTATLILLCICFVLSGVAALVYQTAWTRQFAILFGTSELAIATVLAAYMGGLALGAWLVERLLPRFTRPVFTYALLEIGIAASAIIAVPALLWMANQALQAFFGNQPEPPGSDHTSTALFYLVSAFIALAIPTTLMGATLPLLARFAVSEEAQIGHRIGLLYAMNTLGAVLGALLAAFALLPEFGLSKTIWVAAVLNGLVVLLAMIVASRSAPPPPPKGYSLGDEPEVAGALSTVSRPKALPLPPPRPRVAVWARLPSTGWVLPLMFLAGAVAFFQEVLWSRMLGHVVGSSIHAFGVMVASFLSGIALGGVIGALLAKSRERAATWLAVALLLAAIAAAAAYLLLDRLLPAETGLLRNTFFSALLMLPMTIAIGMTYPLAVRVLARDADDAAPASARVYAWNTVGAIIGSLAAGFLVIPELRYEGAIQSAVIASAALGIAAAWVLVPPRRVFAIAASVIALAGCLLFRPQPPWQLLKTSTLNANDKSRVLFYDVGRSASVVVLSNDGGLALRTNGLPEAMMQGPGAVDSYSGEYWLSPLAVIARPDTRDMLVVGYGGGVIIEALPQSVRKVDVIELEPKVLDGNRATQNLRKRNPLNDTRVNVIDNDARGALRLTSRRYDAIVSQPSHPWTAGASHLYTREFVALAREHLTPGGVFVQWMNVAFMDEALLRSLTATLLDVFPEVRIYRPDAETVVFLASDLPLNLEQHLLETGLPLRSSPLHYARLGINNAEDLVAALALDTEGARTLSRGAPLITDDFNRIATSNVYEKRRGLNADSTGRLLAALDPLRNPRSAVYTQLRPSLDIPYLARRIGLFIGVDRSAGDRIVTMMQILEKGADKDYLIALLYRLNRQASRSNELLRLGVDDWPQSDLFRQEFLTSWLGALVTGQAPAEVVDVAKKLGPRSTALLNAQQHAAKAEWREVALADGALSQIPWTDAWYTQALQLRAAWRLNLDIPDRRKQLADEVILMVDRVALLNPSLDILGIRIRAGLAADRPEVALESVSYYTRNALAMVRGGGSLPPFVAEQVPALREVLDGLAKLPGADLVRIEEVRAEINRLAAS